MAKVRILPDRVANQIAAGEVIERPAAVVKELVENALDAGATRISVEFAHAGRSLIRVEDNGQGMSPEDARTALQRHATSKIGDAADLDKLATFGFRGEALPSIASVSKFTLWTRPSEEDSGTEIAVHSGRLLHERSCGRPVGTRIDVEHLFEPVPARRKFLKSDRTEAGHIVDCVRLYALACPSTSFTLVEDGKQIFRSPECTRLADRVAEIYGPQATEGLLEIDIREEGLGLTGLIGRPGVGRGNRHGMVAFVNTRPVDSRAINGALIESYRESLPEGRYPVAFVFLQCRPVDVDVNVHPAKREVRFRSEAVVRSFVIRAILSTIRDWGAKQAPAGPAPSSGLGPAADLPAPFGSGSVGEPVPRSWPVEEPLEPRQTGRAQGIGALVPNWRFVGTAHENYALFETGQGLVLLDRRAAQERVWYERLRALSATGGVSVQHLLLALSLDLDPVAAAMLTDNLSFFRHHGFEITEFGRNFFRVEALPSWMEPGDAETFIRDLVGAFRDGRIPTADVEGARDEFSRLAAARAVRISPILEETDAMALLRELFATSAPVVDPRGHPTYVELNHGELARRFQK